MKITSIGCLHGHYPELIGGDLLIITGDITSSNKMGQWQEFFNWIDRQKYRKKVMVAGNHDNFCKNWAVNPEDDNPLLGKRSFDYLFDSGTEFEGLKIWGSPWTATFPGINPHCTAFTVDTDDQLAEKWALIPDDTDILITHSPPYMMMDEVDGYRNEGSMSLMCRIMEICPRYHFFSHIHEGYGHDDYWKMFPLDEKPTRIDFYNCSIMNEAYEPINKPWNIEIVNGKI